MDWGPCQVSLDQERERNRNYAQALLCVCFFFFSHSDNFVVVAGAIVRELKEVWTVVQSSVGTRVPSGSLKAVWVYNVSVALQDPQTVKSAQQQIPNKLSKPVDRIQYLQQQQKQLQQQEKQQQQQQQQQHRNNHQQQAAAATSFMHPQQPWLQQQQQQQQTNRGFPSVASMQPSAQKRPKISNPMATNPVGSMQPQNLLIDTDEEDAEREQFRTFHPSPEGQQALPGPDIDLDWDLDLGADFWGSPIDEVLPKPAEKNGVKHEQKGSKTTTDASSSSSDPSQPSTPQEWSMVNQLRQMGFSDLNEIMGGIRHVQQRQQNTGVEAAMMWIIQQREEASESRKMDEARARSERLRAEQAEKRKAAAAERLRTTTLDEWATEPDLFRGSVLLQKAKEPIQYVRQRNADALVRFLRLEKKAHKWYGRDVPFCYWGQLALRWNKASKDRLVALVEGESETLSKGMFSLANLRNGVPTIFLEAKEEAERLGLPLAPESSRKDDGSKEDDDEVQIIEDQRAPKQTEVIEIL